MKKVGLILSAAVMTAMMMTNCSELGNNPTEVIIGNQIWMTKNLNVDTFRNGDPIFHARTDKEWINTGNEGRPAWCYYNNNPEHGELYGKLYNWYAVTDSRGLAPAGWYIPSDYTWNVLESNLCNGDFENRDLRAVVGTKMKSKKYWGKGEKTGKSGNGTNQSKFNGLPGGSRGERFGGIEKTGIWWSTTGKTMYGAMGRELSSDSEGLGTFSYYKQMGMSVRCYRDID